MSWDAWLVFLLAQRSASPSEPLLANAMGSETAALWLASPLAHAMGVPSVSLWGHASDAPSAGASGSSSAVASGRALASESDAQSVCATGLETVALLLAALLA